MIIYNFCILVIEVLFNFECCYVDIFEIFIIVNYDVIRVVGKIKIVCDCLFLFVKVNVFVKDCW